MKKIWDWYYGKASIRKKLIISYLILVILPILVNYLEQVGKIEVYQSQSEKEIFKFK